MIRIIVIVLLGFSSKLVQSDEISCPLSSTRGYFNGTGVSCMLDKNFTITSSGIKLSNSQDENVTEFIGENIETLEFLPEDISENFPNLDLFRVVNTSVKAISKKIFHGLNKLTYVYLEENSIASIDEDTFDDMENLISLKLEDNKISSLPAKIFSKLLKIEFIHLDGNELTALDPEIFKNNLKLVYLTMNENKLNSLDEKLLASQANLKLFRANDNEISTLHSGLFKSCLGLECVYLSKNKITEIPVETFSSMTFLEEVAFADNPLKYIDFSVFKNNKRLNLISFDGIEVKTVLNVDDINDLYQLKTVQFASSGDSCVKGLYGLTEKEKLKEYIVENCITKL